MKSFKCLITTLAVLGPFFFVFPQKAYAYLDPGTGSYILQVAIAALVGGLFAVKIFWNKIKTSFKNLFSRGKKHERAED